jgi:hypothetical protein
MSESLGAGLFRDGHCECCDRDRPVAVIASPFGPASYATCKECLQRPAEPKAVFDYLYDEVAKGRPTELSKHLKSWYTWIDGKYVHWDNYVLRRKSENASPAA